LIFQLFGKGLSSLADSPLNRSMSVRVDESVVLEGRHVRLEPLRLGHLNALCEVGLDPDLWEWIPNPVYSR